MNLTTKIAVIGAASVVVLGTITGVSVFGVNASNTGSWNPKNWKVYKDACKMIEKVKEAEKFGEKFKSDFTAFKAFVSNKCKGEFKCICTKNGDKVDYKFEYVSEDAKKKEKKGEDKSDFKNPENVTVLVGYDAVDKFMEVYKDILGRVLGNVSSQSKDDTHRNGNLPGDNGVLSKYTLKQESVNNFFKGKVNVGSAFVLLNKEGKDAKKFTFCAKRDDGKISRVTFTNCPLVEIPPEFVKIYISGVGDRIFYKDSELKNAFVYKLKSDVGEEE